MDRNDRQLDTRCFQFVSLSARRAWIEIASGTLSDTSDVVALRKESVDRNIKEDVSYNIKESRSPQGERG